MHRPFVDGLDFRGSCPTTRVLLGPGPDPDVRADDDDPIAESCDVNDVGAGTLESRIVSVDSVPRHPAVAGYPEGEPQVWTVHEYFTLTGNNLSWDDTTSTVSGEFYLTHSLYHSDTETGYEPFPGSPGEMAFTVVIEPWDG